MQVYELNFKSEKKETSTFDSFYYKPQDVHQKRLGSLFILGQLKGISVQDSQLLKNLARVISTNYYSTEDLPKESFRKSLKKANKFLGQVIQRGDVSWLSNLGLAVLSLSKTLSEKYEINVTSVGDIQILSLGPEEIIHFEERLKGREIEPYPLRVFSDIISGEMTQRDKILISTNNTYKLLSGSSVLDKISKSSLLNEEKINKLFSKIKAVDGICFLVDLNSLKEKKEQFQLVFRTKRIKRNLFKKFKSRISPVLSHSSLKLPIAQDLLKKSKRILKKRKEFSLILVLAVLVLLGRLAVELEEEREARETKNIVSVIQERIQKADDLIALGDKGKAKALYFIAWQEAQELIHRAVDGDEEISLITKEIEGKLSELDKLQIIEEPYLFFEFEKEEFLPQRIIFQQERVYCFDPYSGKVFRISSNQESSLLETKLKMKEVALFEQEILISSLSDEFVFLKDEQYSETFSLNKPYDDLSFQQLNSFNSNLYFWDEKNNQIIRYRYVGDSNWIGPESWLDKSIFLSEDSKIKSITIDKSIWILKDNSIDRYFGGQFQESLSLNIFPPVENLTKILTLPDSSYLYLLEPDNQRVIVLDRTSGKILKQYQSQKFKNLKDIAVSKEEKKIYLLCGLQIYRIDVSIDNR